MIIKLDNLNDFLLFLYLEILNWDSIYSEALKGYAFKWAIRKGTILPIAISEFSAKI